MVGKGCCLACEVTPATSWVVVAFTSECLTAQRPPSPAPWEPALWSVLRLHPYLASVLVPSCCSYSPSPLPVTHVHTSPRCRLCLKGTWSNLGHLAPILHQMPMLPHRWMLCMQNAWLLQSPGAHILPRPGKGQQVRGGGCMGLAGKWYPLLPPTLRWLALSPSYNCSQGSLSGKCQLAVWQEKRKMDFVANSGSLWRIPILKARALGFWVLGN